MRHATTDSLLLHECLGGAEQDQEMTLTAHHKDRIEQGSCNSPPPTANHRVMEHENFFSTGQDDLLDKTCSAQREKESQQVSDLDILVYNLLQIHNIISNS